MGIDWCGCSFSQPLDYWGIPFRCSKCIEIGNLWKYCTSSGLDSDRESSEVEAWSSEEISDKEQVSLSVSKHLVFGYSSISLLVDQYFLGKLQNLNPSLISVFNSIESEFVKSLKEKGDSTGEVFYWVTQFFTKLSH